MWVFVAIIALIGGVAIFESTPHERVSQTLESVGLPGLRYHAPASQGQSPEDAKRALEMVGPERWLVQQDATNIRLSREFQTPVQSGSHAYYPPQLHLTCYNGSLTVWLDGSLAFRSMDKSVGDAQVRLVAASAGSWELRAPGSTAVAQAPSQVIAQLEKALTSRVTFEMAFTDAPAQRLEIAVNGLAAYLPQLQRCTH